MKDYLSDFDLLFQGVAFSMDANLFALGAIDAVETSSTVVLTLTWNALSASFSLLEKKLDFFQKI